MPTDNNPLKNASNTGVFVSPDDHPIAFGDTIKSLGNGEYGGYIVKFTNPERKDLTGDYFDANTDFMESDYPFEGKVLYHHGLDPDLGVNAIGDVYRAEKRPDGIYGIYRNDFATRYSAYIKSLNQPDMWKQDQMQKALQYEKAIGDLLDSGRLSWSSGALPQSVERDTDGHIKRWAIIERSLTPAPAMPFETRVSSMKSLQPSNLRELFGVREGDASSVNSSKTKTSEGNNMDGMTLEQAKQLLQDFLMPLFAMYREMMGGNPDEAADLETATKDAMEQLPQDSDQLKALTKEQVQAIAQNAAQTVITAHAEKTAANELAVKSFITDAVANGKQKAMVNQEGRSKVPGFSPNNDKKSIERFNINLGAAAPTLLSTIKAMMPGASEEDRRQSGIASMHNEYVDAIKAAQNPYIGPAGGFTVVQEIRDSVLEPLRPEVIAFGLGVRQTSSNGAGAVVIPKMTTAPSAFRPGINTQITSSTATFNTITAMLRPIAAEVVVPIQWLTTSVPSAESMIREQMVKSIALQIDKEIFVGTGDVVSPDTGAAIKGILTSAASANIVTLNAAGRKPGYQDLVNAVTQLSIQNVPEDNTNGWAMHPRTRGTFWGMTDNVAQPLWRADVSKLPYPEMVGYRAAVSTQIPINVATTDAGRSDSSYIFYGRWDMAEYIMANDLAIFVNPYIYANYLQVQLLAYTFSDFVVHYPEAFYVMKDVIA